MHHSFALNLPQTFHIVQHVLKNQSRNRFPEPCESLTSTSLLLLTRSFLYPPFLSFRRPSLSSLASMLRLNSVYFVHVAHGAPDVEVIPSLFFQLNSGRYRTRWTLSYDSRRCAACAFTNTFHRLFYCVNCASDSAAASRSLGRTPGLESDRPSLRNFIGYLSLHNWPSTPPAPETSSSNAILIVVDASTG